LRCSSLVMSGSRITKTFCLRIVWMPASVPWFGGYADSLLLLVFKTTTPSLELNTSSHQSLEMMMPPLGMDSGFSNTLSLALPQPSFLAPLPRELTSQTISSSPLL